MVNFNFDFDPFGQGKKDRTVQGQIKEWIRNHFNLAEDVTILVTEIYCDQPGCAPIETLVAILEPDNRQQFKMGRPMKEVIKEDIRAMIPNPDGHGPRIDVDTLGAQGQWT